MQKKNLDYLKLHLSVLLAGFTGLLGKIISLNEVAIVWYRMILAFILFAAIMFFMGKKPIEKPLEIIKFFALGVLLSVHLMFFFGSVKYANVSVGAVCYSLVGFFTVVFEPLILKVRFSLKELIYSLIAVLGIGLIFNFDVSFRFGIILGIISAALFSLYTLYTQVVETGKSARTMLFYELLGGAVFMSLFLPIYKHFDISMQIVPIGYDWLWIILLSFFCTVFLYLLHISVLRTLSAFTVSLTGNLEPIYCIIFAILFLGEAHNLTLYFYVGMILIILSVFMQSFAKFRSKS